MAEPVREAYPLYWPDGWKRTPTYLRKNSRYQVSFHTAREALLYELPQLGGATRIVISTNIPLRKDGLPYAGGAEPPDSGVAVWWHDKHGKERVMACDQWRLCRENLRAIGLTIEALRMIERAGASDLLERAFTGFAALPAHTVVQRHWRDVLGFEHADAVSREQITRAYRALAVQRHPDHPHGSHDLMTELNCAKDQALEEAGTL